MKKLLISLSLLLFLGCASKKNAVATTAVSLQSECPQQSKCSIEIFDNKTLVVKQDEFGSNYYTLEEDLQKKVIKYRYSNIVKGDIQDASYREEIVFEIDNLNDQEFVDTNLQKTKMLFGRFCFCKGQTGNYKVSQGRLSIQNQKGKLDFTVSEVPQIIKNIEFDIK